MRRIMRKAIPMVIGVILVLIGIGWASQGAGIMGGSSLMDNNPTFIYLGGALAVVGVALVAFGAVSKTKASTHLSM
jgi:xanthine/uracil permease